MAASDKYIDEGHVDEKIIGLDEPYTLFDLTDMFYAFYRYHNEDLVTDCDYTYEFSEERKLLAKATKLSRFAAFRKIEGYRLGSRPFPVHEQINPARPNISFGYFSHLIDYAQLPFKAVLTDGDVVKVRINRRYYNEKKLSDLEKREQDLKEENTPNIYTNREVGEDVGDAFVDVIRTSKGVQKVFDELPLRVTQDGVAAVIHPSTDWVPRLVPALDLVTEPQAPCDPTHWGSFFVIRTMSSQEILYHIRNKTPFWNTEALRWALGNAANERGILSSKHTRNPFMHSPVDGEAEGESFSVRSFYADKGDRAHHLSGWFGNIYVVEGWFVNTTGGITHVIFFPSHDCAEVDLKERKKPAGERESNAIQHADVLFKNDKTDYRSLADVITVFPFKRSEPSLERQRAYGHELGSILELVTRLDSSIVNLAIIMGIPLTQNLTQGSSASDSQDLEIDLTAATVDLGDRKLVETSFKADLNAMLGVRKVLLSHAAAKTFLGGLDGQETAANGRGGQLANLRLVRDGRVHKHYVQDFSESLREMLIKMFRKILDLNGDKVEDPLLKHRFFDIITELHGHPETLLKFDDDDVLEDTNLPYWMSLDVVKSGGSYFGAAEMVLYTEIMNVFGPYLGQQGLQNLSRMAIRSLLGQEDSIDILGDPKDEAVTDQDQIYRAFVENASILGAVDEGAVNFQPIPVLEDKDDHVAHLTQGHLPVMQNMIQMLQEGEVSPAELQEVSEQQLVTRTSLILKVAALANHVSQHVSYLNRFGGDREDINRLQEEANIILQTSEGLLNNLQLYLRALETKRREKELRLQNISPENEAAKMKAEVELRRIQAQREKDQGQLMLANKIADQKQRQHVDKQISKARDRSLKRAQAERQAFEKDQELDIKRAEVAGKNQERMMNAYQPTGTGEGE